MSLLQHVIVIFGMEIITINQVITDTLISNSGCGSIISLILTINNSSFTQENISTCGSYLWNEIITINQELILIRFKLFWDVIV